MAATVADLSRLDKILKDRPILDEIQKVMNTATPMAEKITQTLTLSGRKGIFPVQFGVNEGIYARADKGTFGNSQVDAPVLAEVTAKFIYATFDISGPTMSATRDRAGSFEDALALQLENTTTGVKLDMARMILNGALGVIGIVKARTGAATFTATSPFGLTTYVGDVALKNLLRINMPIESRNAATSWQLRAGPGAISTLTHASGVSTVGLDANETATIVAADEIFRQGNTPADGSTSYEPAGFFAAINTTTPASYLGVTRSGRPEWQGTITDASGGTGVLVALDPDMLRDELDAIMETSGRTPNYIVCNYKQRRNIYNLFAPQIRYMPMVVTGGLRENSVAFDDIPVLVERFFPAQHIGFLDTGTWYHAIDKDVEWIEGMSGTVLNFLLTSDTFRAVLRTYRNFACLFPAANGYIYSISE